MNNNESNKRTAPAGLVERRVRYDEEEENILCALKEFGLFIIAISFGCGLIYLDVAVYEYINLRLVSRYLLSIYGGFMGCKIFNYIVERRREHIDGDA